MKSLLVALALLLAACSSGGHHTAAPPTTTGTPYTTAKTLCEHVYGHNVVESSATTVEAARRVVTGGFASLHPLKGAFPGVDGRRSAAWCVITIGYRGTLTPAQRALKDPRRCYQESAVTDTGAATEIGSVCGIAKPFRPGPPIGI